MEYSDAKFFFGSKYMPSDIVSNKWDELIFFPKIRKLDLIMNNIIVHITGSSGSGKTTLGKKIGNLIPNAKIIDTDDIDDLNVITLLHSKKYDRLLTDESIDYFFDVVNELNMEMMLDIYDKYRKRPLIIVGHTLNNNPADPANYATFKYCIDSDPTKIYKQYIERTYKDIHTNYDHIESLIKKETNPYKIDLLLINKYKIRPSPPYIAGFGKNVMRTKEICRRDEYMLMTSDEIYNDIKERLV